MSPEKVRSRIIINIQVLACALFLIDSALSGYNRVIWSSCPGRLFHGKDSPPCPPDKRTLCASRRPPMLSVERHRIFSNRRNIANALLCPAGAYERLCGSQQFMTHRLWSVEKWRFGLM